MFGNRGGATPPKPSVRITSRRTDSSPRNPTAASDALPFAYPATPYYLSALRIRDNLAQGVERARAVGRLGAAADAKSRAALRGEPSPSSSTTATMSMSSPVAVRSVWGSSVAPSALQGDRSSYTSARKPPTRAIPSVGHASGIAPPDASATAAVIDTSAASGGLAGTAWVRIGSSDAARRAWEVTVRREVAAAAKSAGGRGCGGGGGGEGGGAMGGGGGCGAGGGGGHVRWRPTPPTSPRPRSPPLRVGRLFGLQDASALSAPDVWNRVMDVRYDEREGEGAATAMPQPHQAGGMAGAAPRSVGKPAEKADDDGVGAGYEAEAVVDEGAKKLAELNSWWSSVAWTERKAAREARRAARMALSSQDKAARRAASRAAGMRKRAGHAGQMDVLRLVAAQTKGGGQPV